MSAQRVTGKTESASGHSSALEHLLPALQEQWAGRFAAEPAPMPAEQWLELLQSALDRPDHLPARLRELLPAKRASHLETLLNLTVSAAQAADALPPQTLLDLLTAQHRLRHVAQTGTASQDRPDLWERYWEVIAELDRLLAGAAELEPFLDAALEVISQRLGYLYLNLFLVDTESQQLVLKNARWQGERPWFDTPPAVSLTDEEAVEYAASLGRSLLARQGRPSGVINTSLPIVQSQLAAPMRVDKKLVGVLDVGSDRPDAFTGLEQQVVLLLAQYIAQVVESFEVRRQMHHYRRVTELLFESASTLGNTLDVDTLLRGLAQKLVQAVDAGACVICRLNRGANAVTAVAEYIVRYPGNPDRVWRSPNQPVHLDKDPVARQVVKTRRAVIGRLDTAKGGRPPAWTLATTTGKNKPHWGTLFALPLEVKGRLVGLLEIYHKNPAYTYSGDDIQLIRILATLTAVAMEYARAYTETRQRLHEVATLYTMAQEITGELDLQALLDHIVITLRQALGCRGCCVFLLDPDTQYLEIKAADGLKPHWKTHARLKLGEGIAGQVAATGRPMYVPDTHKMPDFIFFDKEVRSLLAVPLFAHGEVIGVINVDDSRPDAFDKAQERMLTITASQAGIIIDNARLFGRVSAEKQQIQAIIQHMADGVLLMDRQGRIVTCNQSLAMMLGLHTGQIIGQNIHSADLPANLADITRPITPQPPRTDLLAVDVSLEYPQARTLRVFATPVYNKDGGLEGEVRVIHDITREKELEELKDNFFAMISHELRTPLFSIQGFTEILQDEKNLDEATRAEFLATIRRQAVQLSEMVSNLLDFSRFERGKIDLQKEPVEMERLVHQTVLKLQGYAHQQKVHLETDLPANLPVILGDHQRLEQVLTNLIGNAIKFSPQEGTVVIQVSAAPAEIQVKVHDDGPGIPEKELRRIFEPYYQVKQTGERGPAGTGLGLYISRKIIEEHGGKIWAESRPGEGSTFCFTLSTLSPESRLPGQ